MEWLRIDDPIGAVPVHGICGIWGTLSLGFFACGKFGVSGAFAADNTAPLTGLFYGGGVTLLAAQALGSLIVTTATFGVSLLLMYGIHAMGLLRVSREGELEGLDRHEHGITAYPELDMEFERMDRLPDDSEVTFSPGHSPSEALEKQKEPAPLR